MPKFLQHLWDEASTTQVLSNNLFNGRLLIKEHFFFFACNNSCSDLNKFFFFMYGV